MPVLHPGPGFQRASQPVFRLGLPHPDHHDARGAAYVLSRRCWQDGSIHYSYFQASQVFSICEPTRAARGTHVGHAEVSSSRISVVAAVLWISAAAPRTIFRNRKDTRYYSTLLARASRMFGPAVDNRQITRIPPIKDRDAKTPVRVAMDSQLPVNQSLPNPATFADLTTLPGLGVVGAVGFEPTTSTV